MPVCYPRPLDADGRRWFVHSLSCPYVHTQWGISKHIDKIDENPGNPLGSQQKFVLRQSYSICPQKYDKLILFVGCTMPQNRLYFFVKSERRIHHAAQPDQTQTASADLLPHLCSGRVGRKLGRLLWRPDRRQPSDHFDRPGYRPGILMGVLNSLYSLGLSLLSVE